MNRYFRIVSYRGAKLILFLGVFGILACWQFRPAVGAVAAVEPLVILKIADLHVTSPDSMAEFKQVIEFANAAIHPTLTYIAGDTPDAGTLEQYETYRKVMDTICGPVYNVAGDHEARGGGLAHYAKLLGPPTYSVDVGRYHIIGMNSMELSEKQLAWARADLQAARTKRLVNLMFIHHDVAGLKDKAVQESLRALNREMGVKMVLAGHTHKNIVINDGHGLEITTTSIKAPRGEAPKGYALVTLDQGRAAWHFVPLDQRPVLAVCSPLSKLMTTGPEGVVHGKTEIRVKVFDTSSVKSVVAKIDDGSAMTLKADGNLWTTTWDATAVADGEHTLCVTVTNAQGQQAKESLAVVVDRAGTYNATPATVGDGPDGGPKGPKPDGKKPEKGPKEGKKKESVALEQIPAAAREAIRKHAGDVALEKLEKEDKDGRMVYIAKWLPKEQERELRVSAEGKLLEKKEKLTDKDLPDAVREAIAKTVPGGRVVERKRKETFDGEKAKIVWEINVEADGRKLPPLRLLPDGAPEK